MKSPFSIIIPTYNAVRFLRSAIDSIWRQVLTPLEIIVVDDCSTDDTVELARGLAINSPILMRVITLEQNSGGPAKPINIGLENALGEWVCVLDQDDTFHPERLRVHLEAIRIVPDASVVFGNSANIETPECPRLEPSLQAAVEANTERLESSDCLGSMSTEKTLELLLTKGNITGGFPAFSFRRSYLEEKGVDESFQIAADYELLCRLASYGPFVYHSGIDYYRSEHDSNLTKKTLKTTLETANIRERYLLRSISFAQRSTFRELREWFHAIAYWIREAGHPVTAIRLHLSIARIWGWDAQNLFALAKVFPAHLFRRLTLRQPRISGYTTDH